MLSGTLHADELDFAGDEENDRYDYRHMMNRDKRRWAKADQNGDGLLTKAEFADFLHPEEVEHMKDIVIDVSTKVHFIQITAETLGLIYRKTEQIFLSSPNRFSFYLGLLVGVGLLAGILKNLTDEFLIIIWLDIGVTCILIREFLSL